MCVCSRKSPDGDLAAPRNSFRVYLTLGLLKSRLLSLSTCGRIGSPYHRLALARLARAWLPQALCAVNLSSATFGLCSAFGDRDRTIHHGAYPDGTAIRFESFRL